MMNPSKLVIKHLNAAAVAAKEKEYAADTLAQEADAVAAAAVAKESDRIASESDRIAAESDRITGRLEATNRVGRLHAPAGLGSLKQSIADALYTKVRNIATGNPDIITFKDGLFVFKTSLENKCAFLESIREFLSVLRMKIWQLPINSVIGDLEQFDAFVKFWRQQNNLPGWFANDLEYFNSKLASDGRCMKKYTLTQECSERTNGGSRRGSRRFRTRRRCARSRPCWGRTCRGLKRSPRRRGR